MSINSNFFSSFSSKLLVLSVVLISLEPADTQHQSITSSIAPIQTQRSNVFGPSPTLTFKSDEIYIDDEAQEGSGDHDENIHDDLEKDDDDDYSGSGEKENYGEDDEDHSSTRGRKQGSKSSGSVDDITGTSNNRHDSNHGSGDGNSKNQHEIDDEDLWTTFDPKPNNAPKKPHLNISDVDKTTVLNYNTKINSNEEDGNNDSDLSTTGDNKKQGDLNIYKNIGENEVLIMDPKQSDRSNNFFAQPGILAAVIGGAVVGLLCAILVVMFIVYRMRKKDEGSYALDEPKRSPASNSYAKSSHNREFYA
jgi:syndecan 2